jgi:hypothetical protein
MRYLGCACLLTLILTTSATREQQLLGPQAALFEQALAQAGLSMDDARIDLDDRGFFGGDKYRLPFFDALTNDPWKLSPYTRKLTDQLIAPGTDMTGVLIAAQLRLSQGIRLGLLGDPVEPYAKRVADSGDNALDIALSELWGGTAHEPLSHDDLAAAPAPVRNAAALYLFALPDILRQRHNALAPALAASKLDPAKAYPATLGALGAADQFLGIGEESGGALMLETLADNCDFHLLNAGGTLATAVVQRMTVDLVTAQLGDASFKLALPTPHGWVELSGAQPDTHRDYAHYALVIDTGGHDQYGPVAVSSFDSPCSVCIDLAGDDLYSNTDAGPAFGAGVFGYGIHVDLAGNDTYESSYASEGCGIFGVGILADAAGDDTYSGIGPVQGAGCFGTGILIDDSGVDAYNAYQLSQGFGYTLGVGLLLDRVGNDIYTGNDTDIRFPSAQSPEHNSSFVQGTGMGRRADFSDGHSWAGGVGMLVDGAGDDKYSCGVFGQACAYWYGVGILADKSGADQYNGVWYVQAADAHFGLCALQDDAGDDKYVATMNMAQGAGHDFSIGWLEDSAGNDSYSAPNLSLGGANANGIGVLWDKGGDDTYLSTGVTLGAAGGVASPSVREFMLNLGIFIDGGGSDGYWESKGVDAEPTAWPFAGDGKLWRRDPMSTPAGQWEFGVGVDAL